MLHCQILRLKCKVISQLTLGATASHVPQADAVPVIPSLAQLQESPAVQRGLDQWVRHLSEIPDNQGKYKTQRGGTEVVYVKR